MPRVCHSIQWHAIGFRGIMGKRFAHKRPTIPMLYGLYGSYENPASESSHMSPAPGVSRLLGLRSHE